MKPTPKRLNALKDAANGIDYPGSPGVRRALEKEGLIQWTGPTQYDGRINRDDINFNLWRITKKGIDTLSEWENNAA